MFNFNIINPPISFVIKEKIISEICNTIEIWEKTPLMWTLNIVFVKNSEIQELNKNYRNKDSITDVLSFHYFDDFTQLDQEEIIGEIILTEEKIIVQWKEYKLGSELECYKLIIHSIFHIIGYDHENDSDYLIMKQKEDDIWWKIFY